MCGEGGPSPVRLRLPPSPGGRGTGSAGSLLNRLHQLDDIAEGIAAIDCPGVAQAYRVAVQGSAFCLEAVTGGVHVIEFKGDVADARIAGPHGGGGANLLRCGVLEELKIKAVALQHDDVGGAVFQINDRGDDLTDGRVPGEPADLLKAEQVFIEVAGFFQVGHDKARVVKSGAHKVAPS